MKYRREEHGLTMGSDGKIYVIGGFNGKQCMKLSERYNLDTNKWEEIAQMHYPRRSLCAVTLGDYIYAIGGYNGEKYLDVVERYDIKDNKWTIVESMKHPRCTMVCVSSLNCKSIFSLGGYDGKPLNSVEQFNPVYGTWEYITSMRYKRFMHSGVISIVNP